LPSADMPLCLVQNTVRLVVAAAGFFPSYAIEISVDQYARLHSLSTGSETIGASTEPELKHLPEPELMRRQPPPQDSLVKRGEQRAAEQGEVSWIEAGDSPVTPKEEEAEIKEKEAEVKEEEEEAEITIHSPVTPEEENMIKEEVKKAVSEKVKKAEIKKEEVKEKKAEIQEDKKAEIQEEETKAQIQEVVEKIVEKKAEIQEEKKAKIKEEEEEEAEITIHSPVTPEPKAQVVEKAEILEEEEKMIKMEVEVEKELGMPGLMTAETTAKPEDEGATGVSLNFVIGALILLVCLYILGDRLQAKQTAKQSSAAESEAVEDDAADGDAADDAEPDEDAGDAADDAKAI